MTARYSCPKRLFAVLLALILMTLERNAAASVVGYANEFWISTSNTANMYSSGAQGSIDNPFDGSSQANFDANMNAFPPGCTIHIMAGTYFTEGSDGYLVKSGQKILGSGSDVTVLLMTNVTSSQAIISSDGGVTNVEISDLTCDGSGVPSYNISGVGIDGTRIAIRRVKVVNLHSTGTEVWGIVISNYELPNSEGNIIEECEVSHYGSTSSISALSMQGGAGGTYISGIVRDNKVLLPIGANPSLFGVNGSWTHDYLVDGNYIDGANSGLYMDTGGCTNLTVVHNTVRNCTSMVSFYAFNRYNITIAFNNATITNSYAGDPLWTAALVFDAFGSSGTCSNVFIFGNNVSYLGGAANQTEFVDADNVTGLTIANNSVSPGLTNCLGNCFNVTMYNNADSFGNYLSDMNIPLVGDTEVSYLGLNILGSTNASEVLTNLGLPGNVGNVLTNDYTQAVTLNNNLTVNGSATITGEESVDGGLAIGGATPNFSLSAASASGTVAEFLSSEPNLSLIRFGNTNWSHLMYIGERKASGDSLLFLDEGAHTNTPMMVIDSGQSSDGNVGIGTNLPSQRLTVAGGLLVTGTNSAAYLAGDMSQGSNYNAGNLTGTEPVSVLNPIVVTNRQFFILPPDALITSSGGGAITAGLFTMLSNQDMIGWICPSNSSGFLFKSIPLPSDYWGNKLNYVASWKIRTTVPGTYSLEIGIKDLLTNDLSDWAVSSQTAVTFTAPANTNTTTIFATNSISTTNVNALMSYIYTGNQIQPGDFSILSGKITAQ